MIRETVTGEEVKKTEEEEPEVQTLDSLMRMNKADLLAMATEVLGVEIDDSFTKSEIAEKILAGKDPEPNGDD